MNILLLGIISLFGIGLIFATYNSIVNPEYKGLSIGIFFVIFLVFLILYLLSRIKFPSLSAHLFILIFFIATTYFVYNWEVDSQGGLLFYILTREYMKKSGLIKSDKEFEASVDDFTEE